MKPNLGMTDKNRKRVAALLGDILANEVALYIATRGAHWNVTSPQFGALHDLFESQYEALDEILDDVAERIRALGEVAPATVAAYAKSRSIDDGAGQAKDAFEMIASLTTAHEALSAMLVKASDAADDAGDPVTEDFLIGIAEQHQKMAWMLRAHLG